jgi:F0F1-type ATP synthase assembly protein I
MEVSVPLSEHEQRLLEQIERALVDDDPKFASSVRTGDRRLKARRKLQLGALLVVVGLGLLIGGVAQWIPLGVVGFLVMFAGAALAVLNYRSATGAPEQGSGGATAGSGPAGRGRGGRPRRQPLKNRLEERFRRRYDQ